MLSLINCDDINPDKRISVIISVAFAKDGCFCQRCSASI
jgi:hypothetical protein